jgi:hypothetical protein
MPIAFTVDEVLKLHDLDMPSALETVKPAVWSSVGAVALGLLI